MARVNRLFGVKMPEKGVSQLVSVDLEKAIEIKEEDTSNELLNSWYILLIYYTYRLHLKNQNQNY